MCRLITYAEALPFWRAGLYHPLRSMGADIEMNISGKSKNMPTERYKIWTQKKKL